MFLDTVSEDYWKELAEERRIALNESLVENEEVHQTFGFLLSFSSDFAKVNVSNGLFIYIDIIVVCSHFMNASKSYDVTPGLTHYLKLQ